MSSEPAAWRSSLYALLQSRTGLEAPNTGALLELFVQRRVRALHLQRESDYTAYLAERTVRDPEWRRFVDVAANGLTHFFRDRPQLTAVASWLRQRHSRVGRTLQIWSAGTATGEETYTLAILCRTEGIPAEILGTDFNAVALERATAARYGAWTVRHVDEALARRFFRKTATQQSEVNDEARQMVRFLQHNLVLEKPPLPLSTPTWDLIVCRNVFIYYSPKTVSRIAAALLGALGKDGVLAIGASESLGHLGLAVRHETVGGRWFFKQAPEMPKTDVTIPIHAPESFLEVMDRAIGHVRNGEYASARDVVAEVSSKNPHDLLARLSLGHCEYLLHNFGRAADSYMAVLQEEPTLAEAHFFLGLLARKERRYQDALASLQKALYLEPEFWAAAYFLATTAQRLGQTETFTRELNRTWTLLSSERGTMPLLSHEVFQRRLVPTPAEALAACQAMRPLPGQPVETE
jgi:chemotaxis protein methyltransferase CheR